MKSVTTQKANSQKVNHQPSNDQSAKEIALDALKRLIASPKPARRANYLFAALSAIEVGQLRLSMSARSAPRCTNSHVLKFAKQQIDALVDGDTEKSVCYLSSLLTSIRVKPAVLEKALDYVCDRVVRDSKARRIH